MQKHMGITLRSAADNRGRLPFCNTLGDLLRLIEQLAYESLIFLIQCPTRVADETMC